MALEDILTALGSAMKDKLGEVDSRLLKNRKVRDALTTFFVEQETRPELVSQIRSQSLMYEYLQLDLEERNEMKNFNEAYPNYLRGNGREIPRLDSKTHSFNLYRLIKKCRSVEQLVLSFDFYFHNRKIGDIFNSSYLKLNKSSNALGENLLANIYTLFPGGEGFRSIVDIATEIRPEIHDYSSHGGTFRKDAQNQLLIFFDYFLLHRKPGQIFNNSYIRRRLKESFGSLGNRFANNGFTYFNGKGWFKHIIDLAAQQRPEIYMYMTNQSVFEMDGLKNIKQLFDSYIEERKKGNLRGVIFGPTYIREHWRDSELLNGARMRHQGWQKLFQLATLKMPEINKYVSDRELLRIEAPEELIKFFDFYLAHNQGKEFNVGYLQNSLLLKENFGRSSYNLYNRTRKNFLQEGGIQYIVQLAAQERPEILKYWSYDGKKAQNSRGK